MYKPRKSGSTRIEVRSPDSADQPLPVLRPAAGRRLKGVEEGYELPPGPRTTSWSLSEAERKALGIARLPGSLAEAIA
jgi:glutamine synthetase